MKSILATLLTLPVVALTAVRSAETPSPATASRDPILLVQNKDVPNAEHPLTEEDKLHLAIREFPDALEAPAKNRFASPPYEARFDTACTFLAKRLEMSAGSLRQKLPAFADQLLKSSDTSPLERAGALFVTGKFADAEAAAMRIPTSSRGDANAVELAGRCAAQLGDLERALNHYHDAASRVSQQTDPLQWAGIQRDLAVVLMSTGRLNDAENLWRRILDVQLAHLAPEHADVLNSRSLLAYLYSREGRFADAADQLREVLNVMEKLHGPNHPDTIIARQNLERIQRTTGTK